MSTALDERPERAPASQRPPGPRRFGSTGVALQAAWQGLGSRERQLVKLAAVALVVLLLWVLALGPATRTMRRAPAEQEALDVQLQQMQAQATEATTLRGAAGLSPDQARNALEAAAARLEGRAKLTLQGRRATLVLKGISSAELMAFLAEARAGARARTAEASLNQVGPGQYDGTLTLVLAGAGT